MRPFGDDDKLPQAVEDCRVFFVEVKITFVRRNQGAPRLVTSSRWWKLYQAERPHVTSTVATTAAAWLVARRLKEPNRA